MVTNDSKAADGLIGLVKATHENAVATQTQEVDDKVVVVVDVLEVRLAQLSFGCCSYCTLNLLALLSFCKLLFGSNCWFSVFNFRFNQTHANDRVSGISLIDYVESCLSCILHRHHLIHVSPLVDEDSVVTEAKL